MPSPGPWSQKPPPHPKGPPWLWLVVGALLVGVLVAWLVSLFPEAMDDEESRMRLLRRLALLALVGASVIMHARLRPKKAFKNAMIWIAIGVGLLLAYSLRHDAAALGDRLLAELLPHRGMSNGTEVVLNARRGGHFVVEAEVDGVPVRFMVDTGASDVVLSPRDAGRLGFDPKRLSFDKAYRTANGMVMGAPVRVGHIKIGHIAFRDVRASVNGAPMATSLLGMSFLSRLSSYEVTGDRLTLRP